MILYECRNCGRKYYEKRAVCMQCRGTEFVEREASGRVLCKVELYVTPSGYPEHLTLEVYEAEGVHPLVGVAPDEGLLGKTA